MFNSSKISDSPRKLKNNIPNPNEESVNETSRSFALPKITSTPRSSIFATPPKSLVLTPRRYSLSEIATPPRNNRREFIRSNSQNPPGPLLASTKYNINVSTFEDVKSPGLTNRIVQYNEEAERDKDQRRHTTHQTKYGSLGLFPVVHLFKKKLPVLEQKRRHVTVRIASPDYLKHTPEYNRKIFDGIVKPSGSILRSPSHSSFSENSTSTRSVLDALKEISRKRIHANEELELRGETGKRIRTETEDCTDSNKRVRDDSPLLETTSPTRQVSKKICMYDEYAASRSSMDFLRKPEPLVPKRKSISTITENSKDSKQVKLINAETQTIPEEKPTEEESKDDDNKKDVENEKSEKVETVLKVFDDAPLERIRKNRLAALMGTLVGKDPVLEPKPDYSSLLQDETDKPDALAADDTIDKPLVSILTPTNKSPKKNDKHVHFNIPESISESTDSLISTEKNLTETSDSVDNKKVENVASTTDAMPIISVSVPPSTVSTPSFSFDPKPTSNSLPSLFPNKPEVPSTVAVADLSKPSVVTTSIATISPPKVGGFKFDIAKPAPTSTVTDPNTYTYSPNINRKSLLSNTTSIPTFGSSLVTTTVSSNIKAENKMNTLGEAFPKISSPFASKAGDTTESIGSKPSFSFGTASNTPSGNSFNFDSSKSASAPASSNSSNLFGTTSSTNVGFSTVTTSAKTSFSTFTSVANKDLITSPSVTSNFGSTSASVQPTFGTTLSSVSSFKSPSFGNVNTTNTPNFSIANTTSTPSFGSTNSTAVAPFGVATTTTAVPSFGNINTTNSPAFGIGSNTNVGGFATNPTFGNSNTPTNIGFGANSTSVNSGYGTSANTSGFGTSATPAGFGTSTTPAGFGTSATPAGFGTSTTSSGFGTSTSSAGNNFGSSTTPGFGAFNTSASNVFGISTPTTTSASFGTNAAATPKPMANPSFAAPNNSGFGTSATSTTASGGFNAGNFGTPTNSTAFGTTTTAAFGFGGTNTTSASTFGAPPSTTVNAGFGTSNTGFGANSGSLFGNQIMPSFGSSSNTPSFGGTNSSGSFSDAPFGAVTTTASVFGAASTTTAPSFTNDSSKIFGGTSATFGTPTTSSMFGSTQSPFGGSAVVTTASSALPFAFNAKTTANPSFGTTNTTTASFGFGSSTTGFGTQQSSTFGTPNKAPIFGNTNATAFGGTPTAAPGFGTTPQQQPFGSTGSVFNKPQSPPNSFGSGQFSFVQQQQQNNTTSFGTKPANQAGGVFTFGPAPAEKPGGFNFAPTSTETPKKFDFTGAPAAPPAFGAAFGGSPASGIPNFGTATPPAVAGGFSIGSGPPASNRPRPMIKGKRRT